MSQEDGTFEDLLCSSFHNDKLGGVESSNQAAGSSGDECSTSSPPPIEAPLICAGCGGRVCDRFVLLAAGRVWHGVCLRCSQCQCELQAHPSLYCRDGNIYCQQDYCRLFSVGRCARCSQPIPSSALVMRSGELTFHPQCFSCQECDVPLLPGNLYCMEGRSLYCQSHYHGDSDAPLCHTHPLQHTQRDADAGEGEGEGEGEEPASSPEPRQDEMVAGGGAHRRTKRIRTCFRNEQLRALESYFALKHNPDGKDWSCLSHRTGLPKRVLQVWFQNARAKLRRSRSADPSLSVSPVSPSVETTATVATSLTPTQNSHGLQTSTIDQLELLSLLAAPLSDTPQSPAYQREGFKDSLFLDYNTQGAPRLPPLMAFDFDESGVKRGGDCEEEPPLYYC